MKQDKLLGALFLSLAASIWGGMFVVVKVVVSIIPPVELVWLRYLIAFFALLGFSIVSKTKWHIRVKDLGMIFLIGLIGNTISIVFQETGTWLSSAQTGAVITSATPTFMIIFAWIILKEKLTVVKLISVLTATVGVLLIVGVHFSGKNMKLGSLCLVIAALTWALMSVLIKKVSDQYSSLQITIMSTFVAIICLSPYVLTHLAVLQKVDFSQPKVFLSLLYLGIISTALAFVLWNKGLTLMNAGSSGLFFLFQPLVGTLLGWLFLGESISWMFLVGSLLVVSSIWISIRFS